MSPRKPRPNEPRPQCPECGMVVAPVSAIVRWRNDSAEDEALVGLYCRSDCLLDAHERGWPHWLVKGQGS